MLTGRLALEEYLIEERKRHVHATGDFNWLVISAARACKLISKQLAAGRLAGVIREPAGADQPGGAAGLAESVFLRLLQGGGRLAGLASASTEGPVALSPGTERGKYLMIINALEGISNLDVNLPAGSLFSIVRAPNPGREASVEDFLRAGSEQVCAGFAIYGPTTMLVLTVGNGTVGFTLDPILGEFVLTHPRLQVAGSTREFAIEAVNYRFWDPAIKRYVDECIAGEEGPRGDNFQMRWVASLLAELHRILLKGGVFLNPMHDDTDSRRNSCRLVYEANPVAFIVEQAGGVASDGTRRILDIPPSGHDHQVGLFFGSQGEIERIHAYHDDTSHQPYDAPLFGIRSLFRDNP